MLNRDHGFIDCNRFYFVGVTGYVASDNMLKYVPNNLRNSSQTLFGSKFNEAHHVALKFELQEQL